MKTKNRNAVRSESLIKTAFIELLKAKPASKITVTDIIKGANISRGTFYAHYKDTLDLLESFQTEFFNQLIWFAENNNVKKLEDKVDLLLNEVISILKNDYDTYNILANQDFSFQFYHEIKSVIIAELLKEYPSTVEIERTLNICIGGFIMLLREWLENPDFEAMEEYAKAFSYLHKLYFNTKEKS